MKVRNKKDPYKVGYVVGISYVLVKGKGLCRKFKVNTLDGRSAEGMEWEWEVIEKEET